VQIRNIATMGGNICNASPIGDSAPCLIALDVVLTLRSASGSRIVPIDGFFTGYRRTLLRPGEYLAAITIPKLRAGESFHAYKLAKRFEQDVSSLAAAARVTAGAGAIKAVRIAFGGMAATPLRASHVEAALQTKADMARAISKDFLPLSDFRGSAAYRRQAALGLTTKLRRDIAQPGEFQELWQL
jgi:xanthine dehydrogenase small subunit